MVVFVFQISRPRFDRRASGRLQVPDPVAVRVTFAFFFAGDSREAYVLSQIDFIERKINAFKVARAQSELKFRIGKKNIGHTDADGWLGDVLDLLQGLIVIARFAFDEFPGQTPI